MKAAEIPEALVYRIFFQELAAYQRKADELEAQGKNAALVRNRHRQLTVLPDAEFRMLTAQALAFADTLAANLQASARIAQAMPQSLDKAGFQAQIAQLRQDSDAAVAASVGQLRTALGPQRFSKLDQRVRTRVAANLKIYTVQEPLTAPLEGK